MILCDTHLHTAFSPDSEEPPYKMFDKARELGLQYMAITDHIDNGSYRPAKPLDLNEYFDVLRGLGKQYPELKLSVGIEMGYTPYNAAVNKAIIDNHDFDCVINSVHEVNGKDCYFPEYFEGKDKHSAYLAYFRQVRESLDAPYYYSTLGHLGYVVRNAPYPKPLYEYDEFGDILDDILLTLIRKGKILEINSSMAQCADTSIPNRQVLERYYRLGGRLISYGSDAHSTLRLTDGYNRIVGIAKSVGFDSLTVVRNRQNIQLKI